MKHISPLLLLLFITSCVKTLTIIPTNEDGSTIEMARVVVNGTPTGQGSTNIRVDGPVNITIDASPEYYATNFTINQNTSSPIMVPLVLDDIYALTTADPNKRVNLWLTLTISESAKENKKWWTVVVNAISTQDFEMELLDPASGFIRSAWKITQFEEFSIRRRFIGNVVSTDPLRWRVKYQVQTNSVQKEEEWTDYDRGLKDELKVIEEIRDQNQEALQ